MGCWFQDTNQYITAIEERQEAHASHDAQKVNDLTVQIKKKAKKQKQRFFRDSLMESNDPRKQWAARRDLTKKRYPNSRS